ncbi:MAG: hypothetical protein ACOX2M_09600 [Fastidiosipilaceae bacterium]
MNNFALDCQFGCGLFADNVDGNLINNERTIGFPQMSKVLWKTEGVGQLVAVIQPGWI